jgi:hypothetical protein
MYNMNNYYNFWSKRIISDALKAIKLIIGLGLSIGIGSEINLPLGFMFFGYVLVDSLISKN